MTAMRHHCPLNNVRSEQAKSSAGSHTNVVAVLAVAVVVSIAIADFRFEMITTGDDQLVPVNDDNRRGAT